ncbi:hybrid sensor histidine kinase/response regulator [Ramlibacter tataouinensis]|uniref:histidine kinase n=1 Tax=Ramlibacter tataouinensis (strain ATCC BAA-407 / DSM 14655 / LMG 21543 / TTB310) TaxID=365046 RepID=F5XZW0_RAMTT|nr:response regulator [Ramlibacter tataouinensis]AEG93321.1 candidate histidine kinase, atypical hybrid [Ramlibacter tataouinensis TTB310]
MDRAASIQATIDRSRHTVLVVDDNPATRYSTGRVVRAAGFRMAEAGTGEEALALCAQGTVSAVVLDVHLPDTNGFEVCRVLRSQPPTRLLPVVHLSAAFVRNEHHVTGLDAGADAYLVHPVEPAVLVATLQALIRARMAEDDLRRSEGRLRAIYDQAQSGIAVIDEQGRFLDANPAMLGMLGRRQDEVLHRGVLDLVPPGHRDRVGPVLAAGGAAWRGDFPLLHASGRPVHLQWSLSQPAGGGARIATAIDVSEKHELEERRRDLLEREQAARAEAERLSRTKDDFIAVLSHELRTPLNAIIGWVHILKRRNATPETGKGLDAIERNVKTQARIISDILDVSRINSGKLQLEAQWIDPADLVRSSLASLATVLEERQVRVDTDFQRADEPALLDPARYQQIFWNLMTNAIKFSPVGGRVEVSLAREGDRLRLDVRDFGVGIKPEFIPHLFDRFTQSDSPGNRRHGGLGLGLSIVKHLVDLHGGTVEAVSDGPGLGTLMRVVLPTSQAAAELALLTAPEQDEQATQDALSLRGVDVLVVEDDREAGEMMSIVLADRGAEVRLAADYSSAVAQLDRHRPDMLISDIGLPGRDGYELARHVRQQEAHSAGDPYLPLIALTAFARPQDQRKALEAGFDLHLAKPLKPLALLTAIQELLARRHHA